MTIKRSFFLRHPAEVAKDLLGMKLYIQTTEEKFCGIISETEAYASDDPASHSFKGISKRNQQMFSEAGFCYVYFIYGMYHCLNFVTEKKGVGSAVLIRALIPENESDSKIFSGPGKICKELGIDLSFNGEDLFSSKKIWLEKGLRVSEEDITVRPRIGISKAKDKLWRFTISAKR